MKQRPITVFPFIYRACASIRYKDTQAWQDSWAPQIFGAVPNRDAIDASWMLALDVEKAVLSSQDLYVALLDNSKYFDYFKRHVLWPLLLYMGAPRKLMRAVAAVVVVGDGGNCCNTEGGNNGGGGG